MIIAVLPLRSGAVVKNNFVTLHAGINHHGINPMRWIVVKKITDMHPYDIIGKLYMPFFQIRDMGVNIPYFGHWKM